MVNNWAFLIAFILLALSISIDVTVLYLQYRAIRDNQLLQPLKWLLVGAITFIALASAPLAFVYADILWLHINSNLIVYIAVIGNAASKVAVGVLLYLVYTYRAKELE